MPFPKLHAVAVHETKVGDSLKTYQHVNWRPNYDLKVELEMSGIFLAGLLRMPD